MMPSHNAMNTVNAVEQSVAPPNSPLEIAVRSLRSPTGRGRHENQDNYLRVDGQGQATFLWREEETRRQLPHWPVGHQRIAVLDGMGGHSHGREAAEQTVQGLLNLPAITDLDQLSIHLDALHRRLYQEFHDRGLESGCTLILLEIPREGPALLFHVGDSRAYAISAEQAQCLTVDHVPATHLAMIGLLDGAEWVQQVHVQTNSQISQAFILGSTLGAPGRYAEVINAELYELHDGNLPLFLQGLNDRRLLPLEPGWIYLFASDGLWHLASPQAFIQRWPALLAPPERSLEALLDGLFAELAETIQQQRSQPDDNCTVILVRRSAPEASSTPGEG